MKQQPNHQSTRIRGVTLIELMIVVVIVAIIAAFAYPSYVRQALKAGRSDATSTLLAIAAAQEKEFLKNNAYTDSLEVLGITTTETEKYTLSLEVPEDGSEFVAKAVPVEGKSQDNDKYCTEFTVDHTGAKRSKPPVTAGEESSLNRCW